MLVFNIAVKCILNVYWLITLIKKVHNFEIRSFIHFPTPKKPLRTNFLPSFYGRCVLLKGAHVPRLGRHRRFSIKIGVFWWRPGASIKNHHTLFHFSRWFRKTQKPSLTMTFQLYRDIDFFFRGGGKIA